MERFKEKMIVTDKDGKESLWINFFYIKSQQKKECCCRYMELDAPCSFCRFIKGIEQ